MLVRKRKLLKIEAIQWSGSNLEEIRNKWLDSKIEYFVKDGKLRFRDNDHAEDYYLWSVDIGSWFVVEDGDTYNMEILTDEQFNERYIPIIGEE